MMIPPLNDHTEPHSTPKLHFSKLPCKPKHPTPILTPPLQPSLSIPFHWEEAPGRPRSSTEEEALPPPPPERSKAVRCLHLPPRLSHEDPEIPSMPSPPVVLEGRSMPLAFTFTFRKAPGMGRVGKGGCGSFGRSRRWRSFRFGVGRVEEKGRGSFGLSQSLGDFFKSEKAVGTARVRRMRSFFDFDSNLLDIFKQAIAWRRR